MRNITRPRQYLPYPEIVEAVAHEQPYRIHDANRHPELPTNGMVDLTNRRLIVPLDERSSPVIRHELAHVLWSPWTLPGPPLIGGVVLAVEDARINMGLDVIRLPVEIPRAQRAYVSHLAGLDLQGEKFAQFLLRAIAALGTNAEEATMSPLWESQRTLLDLAESTREWVRRELVQGRELVRGPVASEPVVHRIAHELAQRLLALGLMPDPTEFEAIGSCSEVCVSHALRPLRPSDGGGRSLRTLSKGIRSASGDSGVEPGEMAITEAPLSLAFGFARGSGPRSWRPATEGSVVRYPHRFAHDRAIFRRSRRVRGGTVLIDTSGSMSLDAADIAAILERAPAAHIAIYSGKGKRGELRIIARDGRRALPEYLEPYGRGNVVDLPALEWLAKRGGPRIWITDGGVTGVEDTGCSALTRRCEATCTKGQIVRVRTVEKAVKALAAGRV